MSSFLLREACLRTPLLLRAAKHRAAPLCRAWADMQQQQRPHAVVPVPDPVPAEVMAAATFTDQDSDPATAEAATVEFIGPQAASRPSGASGAGT